MDFRHLIVTCLFSKLRLPFDNQKVKENYAIFLNKLPPLFLPAGISGFASARPRIFFVPHAGESLFLV